MLFLVSVESKNYENVSGDEKGESAHSLLKPIHIQICQFGQPNVVKSKILHLIIYFIQYGVG